MLDDLMPSNNNSYFSYEEAPHSFVDVGPFNIQKLNITEGFYTNPATWSRSSSQSDHTEQDEDSFPKNLHADSNSPLTSFSATPMSHLSDRMLDHKTSLLNHNMDSFNDLSFPQMHRGEFLPSRDMVRSFSMYLRHLLQSHFSSNSIFNLKIKRDSNKMLLKDNYLFNMSNIILLIIDNYMPIYLETFNQILLLVVSHQFILLIK